MSFEHCWLQMSSLHSVTCQSNPRWMAAIKERRFGIASAKWIICEPRHKTWETWDAAGLGHLAVPTDQRAFSL